MSTATVPAAPERSIEQRREALRKANDIRSRRARLKRDLKAGRRPVDEVLLAPPDYLETARVFDVMLAVPKYGRVKVNKILAQAKVSPSKTIGGLSERQLREVVAFMRRGPGLPGPVCPGCGGPMARGAMRCMACFVTDAPVPWEQP